MKQTIKYRIVRNGLILRSLYYSVKQRNQLHLGTEVRDNFGYHYLVINMGYVINGKPAVKLKQVVPKTDHIKTVKMDNKLEIVNTFKNRKYNALSHYYWYRDSWLDIDTRSVLENEPIRSFEVLGDRANGVSHDYKEL